MKKIIICMLLLLPLIIVASVLLAIDVISVEAYIPVEKVVLNHTYIEKGLSDQSFDDLVASVYPSSARDSNITWTIEDETKTVPDYLGKAAEVDKNGKVSFFTYATFKVIASAGGKSASCTFYIKGDRPESVVIESGVTELSTGQSSMLSAVFHPIDAIVKNVIWTSNDDSVLSVDKNGIVTAKSVGTAIITVSIKDTEIKATKEITVTQGVTPFGQSFYATDDGFSLANIDSPIVESGGHITDNKLYFDDDQAVLSSNGADFTVYKCNNDDITIQNSEFFGENFKLKVGKIPLTLAVIYKEANRSDKPSIAWTSSNTEIAEISNDGLINAKETGNVTFTATDTQTNKEVALTIRVVKPVSLIVLDMPKKEKGIAQNTIYGNYDYIDGQYTPAYLDINFTLPQNANKSEFIYEIDNDLGSFKGNRLYFNDKVKDIQKVVIKVSAKERPYESVEVLTRYEITVGQGVNCYSYNDLVTVTQAGKKAFLQNDFALTETSQRILLKNDIYGNGHKIDALLYKKNKDTASFMHIDASNITVSNLTITMDDPQNISQSNGLKGCALSIGEINQTARHTNLRVEYSIFENCYYGMEIHSSNVEIVGCIIRNTSNFGIFMPATPKEDDTTSYNNVTMINNVMTNMVAPAIGVPTEKSNLENDCTLHVKGFLDIYNWQDINSNKMLDRDIIKGNSVFNNAFKSLLSGVLEKELAKKDYDNIRYTIETENTKIDYIHLGIIQAGGIHRSKANIIVEDPRLQKFELKALTSGAISDVTEPLGLTLEPVYLYLYDINQDITPLSSFQESIALYEKLRGEEE